MTADIFNHLWQSTVFGVAVALVSLAFRHNRARLRCGLWFVASIKFLVPFAALVAAGSLVEWRQTPAPIATLLTSAAMRGFNAPFAEVSLDPIAVSASTDTPDRMACRRLPHALGHLVENAVAHASAVQKPGVLHKPLIAHNRRDSY